MMDPMGKKGEDIRKHIVETANRTFYRHGFQATSFADLAKDSGIPKGNYYFHFKSKDALLEAVIQDRIERLRAQLNGWEDAFPDPKDRLKRAVRMIENEQDDLATYGCPIGTLVSELVKNHPRRKTQLAGMLRLIETWLAEQVAALPYAPKEAQARARAMLRAMQGAAMLTAAYGESAVIAETVADLDALIDRL